MIQFKFYRAFGNNKATLLDKAIAIFTLSKYSHVEIVDNDNVTIRVSPRDDGVSFVNDFKYNDKRWDTVIVDDMDGVWVTGYIKNNYNNCTYNYFGAITSQIPIINWFCRSSKLFCSETGAMYMGYHNPCKYSPGRLYNRLKRKY